MNIENIETAISLFEERAKIKSELAKLKLIEKDKVRALYKGANVHVRYFMDNGGNKSGYVDGSIYLTFDELAFILTNRINDATHKLFLVENKISKL